jgi:DNA-directed RNA polymerase specialized sigma subunit
LDSFQESYEFQSINIYEKINEKEYIRYIINSLPENLKKVIVLKTYSSMNFTEIAEAMKIKECNRFQAAEYLSYIT